MFDINNSIKFHSKVKIICSISIVGAFSLNILGCSTVQTPSSRKLEIERLWARSTISPNAAESVRRTNYSPAIIDGNTLYQANARDGIVSLDRKTGNEIWRFPVRNGVTSGVELHNGKLYFGANDGQFYCLNALTGRTIWNFPTRAETLANPLIDGNTVYFLTGNNSLFALEIETGKQKWIYSRNVSAPLSIRGGTQPAKFGNTVYVGFSDGFLTAVNSNDGNLTWERQLNYNARFRDVDGSPVIENKIIYVSSFDGSLFALSQVDGQVLWRFEAGGSSAVTLDESRIFYSTSDGRVVALEKATGKLIWSYSVKAGVASQPVVFQNLVLFTESMGSLVALDGMTGQHLKSYSTGRGLYVRPTIDHKTGEVYVLSNEANLFAFKVSWIKGAQLLPWQK